MAAACAAASVGWALGARGWAGMEEGGLAGVPAAPCAQPAREQEPWGGMDARKARPTCGKGNQAPRRSLPP